VAGVNERSLGHQVRHTGEITGITVTSWLAAPISPLAGWSSHVWMTLRRAEAEGLTLVIPVISPARPGDADS
jgi:hypothetical protein